MTDLTIQCPFYRLTVATICYLGLPNLLFLGGWLRFPSNLICSLGILALVSFLLQPTFSSSCDKSITVKYSTLFMVIEILIPWLFLSGIGGLGLSTGDILCGDSVIA